MHSLTTTYNESFLTVCPDFYYLGYVPEVKIVNEKYDEVIMKPSSEYSSYQTTPANQVEQVDFINFPIAVFLLFFFSLLYLLLRYYSKINKAYKAFRQKLVRSTNSALRICREFLIIFTSIPATVFLILNTTFIKINSNFKTKIQSLKLIIPAKHREEIIGDLHETYEELKNEQYNKVWIWFIMFSKIILVLYATLKIRLSDLYLTDKEGVNN